MLAAHHSTGQVRLAFFLTLVFYVGCSAGGPPFKGRPGENASVAGRFTFQPSLAYYPLSVGEVVLTPTRQRTDFVLRIVGLKGEGVADGMFAAGTQVRMRHWEGYAYEHQGQLELRAERCYEFGRVGVEERQAPLKGWSCDHLVLVFRNEAGRWIGWKDEVTRFTDWFGPIDLQPQPQAFYGAQVMARRSDGMLLAYGLGAPRVLRRGVRLYGPGGAVLRVESIPGDLVLLSGPALPPGSVLLLRDRPLGSLPISL